MQDDALGFGMQQTQLTQLCQLSLIIILIAKGNLSTYK